MENTLAYYEIWTFPVNYESVMFYRTGTTENMVDLQRRERQKVKLYTKWLKCSGWKFWQVDFLEN